MTGQSKLKPFNAAIPLVEKGLDVVLILFSLFASLSYYDLDWAQPRILILAFCAVSLFLFFANVNGLYNSWRSGQFLSELKMIVYTLAGTGLCLLFLGYVTKVSSNYSRLAIGSWILLMFLALLLARVCTRQCLHHLRAKGYNSKCVAILGSGGLAQQLAMEIYSHSWMGIHIAGFYDNRKEFRSRLDGSPDVEIIGDFNDLIEAAKANEYDDIYVALPMESEKLITELLISLRDSSVAVHLVPDLFVFNLINAKTSSVGKIPVVSVYDSPFGDMDACIKRIEDLVVGTLILVIIAIPMLIIAMLVKATSPGKVIFKQRRYGLGGEVITVWKFRSMTVADDGDVIKQAGKGDTRITSLGRFLRKTSLDELPQFINVLQGRMSIVGPRPHAVAHNELYRKTIDGYMLRHLVKPGITGWAQVNGWRGETDSDEKMIKRVEFDIEYIKNWSLHLDIKIIMLTIFKGFTHKNAY